jgi:hypothetical protein
LVHIGTNYISAKWRVQLQQPHNNCNKVLDQISRVFHTIERVSNFFTIFPDPIIFISILFISLYFIAFHIISYYFILDNFFIVYLKLFHFISFNFILYHFVLLHFGFRKSIYLRIWISWFTILELRPAEPSCIKRSIHLRTYYVFF